MITGVSIAGVPLDPGTVVTEAITVLHGRAAADEGPSASSATLTLLTTSMPTWSVGDPLTINSDVGLVFTGLIADRALREHVDTVERGMCARFELVAAGAVATLGRRPVGDEPWPQEPATARAARVLALTGVPYRVDTVASTVQVNPTDIDARTALDVLDELAADTAAAVIDTPDGTVIFQPRESRDRPVFPFRWEDFIPEQTWADFTPEQTWADFDTSSPASEFPLVLPPSAIGFEPEWLSSAAAIVNSVRLGYGVPAEGGEQATVSMQDDASIARYGRRHYGAETQLALQADAEATITRVLSTRASERWSVESVDVYADALDDPTRAKVAALLCGDWVQLDGLPQPAPATSFTAIVEGWAYREWVTGQTRRAAWTFSLSDPLLSLAVMTWVDFPADYMWSDFPGYFTWSDLTTLSAIGA